VTSVDDKTLTQTDSSAPDVVHPWEDFDSVMRHALRARAGSDLTRSHAFYSRAVELKPNDAQGWIGWASTAQELDEAILGWGYALAIIPQDLRVRDSLHDAIVNKIELDGKDQSESFLALGRRLAQMGLRHYAHQLLVRATELTPKSEEAWLWCGGTTDNSSETTMCLQRVLAINPGNAQARAGLRWTAPKTTGADAATEPVDDVVQIMEDGRRAFSVGNQKRAYELFLRATELAPNDAQAWFWRGTIAADTCAPKVRKRRHARWWQKSSRLIPKKNLAMKMPWMTMKKRDRAECHGWLCY
jgi:tetratricopeptide (TPR) repeat protein